MFLCRINTSKITNYSSMSLFNFIGLLPAPQDLLSNKHNSTSVIQLFAMVENISLGSEFSPETPGSG